MIDLFIVVAASIAAGLLSLSVALFLLRSEKLSAKLIKYGTPFAAGVLLIIAFRDLLPEAIVEDGADVLNSALGAILIFFLIEKGFKSFHHHHEEDIVEQKDTTQGWLFVIGDVFHNLIDGISLGGAFLIGRETGLIATVALISHDIPLEVGEFGNQLRAGFTKKQTIIRNIFSGLTTVLGAVLTYQIGGDLNLPMGYLYGGIAGFFIYIALSDIVPTIHSSEKTRYGLQTGFLLLGLVFGGTVSALAHDYIDVGHNHEDHEDHEDHDDHEDHEDHDDDHEESEETPKPISLLPFDYYLIVPDSVPDKLEVLNYNLGEEIYIQFEARDVEKEIHVHGYDIHFMVYPSQDNILKIELTIAGEFEIENHASGYEFARLIVSP